MEVEYLDTGKGPFPILPAARIAAELEALPTLDQDLCERYLDCNDRWLMLLDREYDDDPGPWLERAYDLWLDTRLSLAHALAYDAWYKETLPPDREHVSEFFRKVQLEKQGVPFDDRWRYRENAAWGCAYHLDGTLLRFYAINEKLLQFYNSWAQLGLAENEVTGRRVRQELQAKGRQWWFFLKQVTKLCTYPSFQSIVEARRGITHRRQPAMQEAHDALECYISDYLPLARDLFGQVTLLLDELLEYVDENCVPDPEKDGGSPP
jgi:hypothetical protein